MADPILTTLCAICHISPPKYKCPRCSIRTCSLACTKKHKAWSECSGERDATAYVPPKQLKTAAGIDHDYNFLHGIERSVERAERLLVGERALVQTEELRPLTVQEVRWKPGRDGRMRKVLVTRVLREAKGRRLERFLSQRLAALNIHMVCAPLGMARQKANRTSLNRRTGRINWQVEWVTLEPSDSGEPNRARTLSKAMDDVPLYQAYHALLEDEQRRKGLLPRRPRGPANGTQDASSTTWPLASYPIQDPFTGLWANHDGARQLAVWPSEKDEADRQRFQYFLARPLTRSDAPSGGATELQAGECLREILANTRVLEFPTVYVLRRGEALPEGFVVVVVVVPGPKDTVPPQRAAGHKRKKAPGKKLASRQPKRRKRGGRGKDLLEEGEVGSDDDGDDDEDSGPDGNRDSGAGGVALEAGDVIAEQSFGEEDEGDDDDDDDEATSSSGSDGE